MAKVRDDITMVDISTILPGVLQKLNERDKRIFLGALAMNMGYGGVKTLSNITSIAETTIRRGIAQIKDGSALQDEQIRAAGGGRKKVQEIYPDINAWVEEIVDRETYGNPMQVRKWSTLSLRTIADELAKRYGAQVSHMTVGKILEELDYGKQQNQKMLQIGESHPDRDRQFKYIQWKSDIFVLHGNPVISIDCKKKENLGNFKNDGQEYRKKKDPRKVKDHDYKDKVLGHVAPYGVYVVNDNTGFVNLGISHDTSEFAGVSVMRWWEHVGKYTFPNATKLFITSDCGGSNHYQHIAWKYALSQIATKTGLEIHVSHYPPGTSKWNKIEHKLFCFITRNWQGRPLVDIVTVINLINGTKTKKGLKVKCVADHNHYELKQKPSEEEIAKIDMIRRKFHGEWNYIIRPLKTSI